MNLTPFKDICFRMGIPGIICLVTGLTSAQKVDFEKEVWPILESRCNDCHDGDSREGQLRLDGKQGFQSGGVSGSLFDGTSIDKSLLMQRILGKGDLDQMPLDEEPLTDSEIQILKRWITAGARWPEHVGEKISVPRKHWAYQMPVRPKLPLTSTWTRNPIDSFTLARMRSRGLSPATQAANGKLLRRVYLDLTGLPPTLADLKSFENDSSSTAYEKVVDRLLASPQFGEKWARPWLDLARYADTNGFQADQFRSVWPYRDWVIHAMNHDMPFDQFSIEQLAGDLLPNSTVDQKIATGFHRLTTCNVEAGVDPEENRVNQIIDRVNTTGTVWFGTTFECMQCHNHKYDPFTQREYYEMFAFFNNTPLEVKNSGNNIQYEFFGPKMDLPFDSEKQALANQLKAKTQSLNDQLALLRKESQVEFKQWLTEQQSANSAKHRQERWVALKIKSFRSQGGALHEILPDQSVLLKGKNPDKDFYTVVVETDLPQVNGFKFETLTHPSLPNRGPGRHAVGGRPNFVVAEITARLPQQENRKIDLLEPLADFSQKNFPVKGLVDGDSNTAWAINPQFGADHWASVLTDADIGRTDQETRTQIKFTFDQRYGGGRNIGRLRISALVGQRTESPLPQEIQQLVTLSNRNPAQEKKLEDHFLSRQKRYSKTSKELAAVQRQLEQLKPETTLVMIESKKRMTRLFKRGNFLDKGEAVTTSTPEVLHPGERSAQQNRLDFARWIFDRRNPLTARVVVNRWWAEIFGQGIVVTGEDFGTQGEPPSHPQLLDWLATELIDSGWSRKKILKTIVMSNTYRQSSKFDPAKIAIDPHNRYLARGPRFRLPAEMLRDNALVISHHLASNVGGPPVYPPQPDGIWRHVGRNAPKYTTSTGNDRFRRGIYVFWRRSAPYPSFVNFDAPDRAACVVSRPKTNTPLQALTLLNDTAFTELSRSLAQLLAKSDLPVSERLRQAFKSCTMREPTSVELQFLQRFFDSKVKFFQENQATASLWVGQSPLAAKTAAWAAITEILFNLDETITKD